MNFKHLTAYLDGLYETEGIPSSDLIVYHHGMEVYRHSAGFQDLATGEPIRRNALYFMYSASKLITVTAALQLLERGKILLNDKLSDYLPEFAEMQVQEKGENGKTLLVSARRPILVRDLFSMTSGLPYDLKAPEIMACMKEHNGAPETADVIRAFAKKPLRFHPGEHWMYGFSHDVLLRLVEVVAGEPFSQYAKKNIFDPVGMYDTYYHLTDELRPRMAAQYAFNKEKGKAEDVGLTNGHIFGPRFESGGAGTISCLGDYIRFAETLTHMGVTPTGKRILNARTVELLRTDCLDEHTRPDFNWSFMKGYGYGLGVRTLVSPVAAGTLSSVGEFGWGGAAGSYIHCDPAREISIVYTQHMLNNKEDIVHPRLRNLIYAALED